jgi:hypothetical protein
LIEDQQSRFIGQGIHFLFYESLSVENADIRVQQITYHKCRSLFLNFLPARISRQIAPVEGSIFAHAPKEESAPDVFVAGSLKGRTVISSCLPTYRSGIDKLIRLVSGVKIVRIMLIYFCYGNKDTKLIENGKF